MNFQLYKIFLIPCLLLATITLPHIHCSTKLENELDSDGDDILDSVENASEHKDYNGRECYLFKDCDSDGVDDKEDRFRTNNCASKDTDEDGMPDEFIPDCTDTELVSERALQEDNCPLVPNGINEKDIIGVGDQKNTDSDMAGDACDPDDDNDGVLDDDDDCEKSQLSFTSVTPIDFASDPSVPATDADGDGCEDDSTEDTDDDNDGEPDIADDFPKNACASKDTDDDTKPDAFHPIDDTACTMEKLSEYKATFKNDDGTYQNGIDENGDTDDDNDGVNEVDIDGNKLDTCPLVKNGKMEAGEQGVGNQLDRDSDGKGNACDADDDDDSVCDYVEYKQSDGSCVYNKIATTLLDQCPQGNIDWESNDMTDINENGCEDGTAEDEDRDNDGIADSTDLCTDTIDWISIAIEDSDQDGCRDSDQDPDDDNDGICDYEKYKADGGCKYQADYGAKLDICPTSPRGFSSNPITDYDGDGCQDNANNDPTMPGEDPDDDNDGICDYEKYKADGGCKYQADYGAKLDICPTSPRGFSSNPITDYDGDGCQDNANNDPTMPGEDPDDDNDGICDYEKYKADGGCKYQADYGAKLDICPTSPRGFSSNPITDYDGDGCQDDSIEDTDDDDDEVLDVDDDCKKSQIVLYLCYSSRLCIRTLVPL